MNSILIIGMGFLGRPLAERADQNAWRVRGVKRHQTSDDICLPIEMDFVALSPDFRQPEWADYGTWAILLPPTPVPQYVETIENIVHQAQQFGVQHLIYASSISVYGNTPRICDEYSSLNPETASAHQIIAAEQCCLNADFPHVDILRFGGLYATERHPLRSLLKRAQIKGAAQPVNMVHRDQAVSALFQAACTPNGTRIRNIVQAEHPSKREFYRQQAQILGLPEPDWDDKDKDATGRIINSLFAS